MDIGFYIADLLRNQDEVGLPGLGTFSKEKVPGSYDRMSNSFRPPSYQVIFTNKLSDLNTTLSEYISSKKNLSPSSAEYFVKKFTSGIFDVLETSGIAEVKPLGIIRQKSENLVFEAATNFEITGKFYGLKPVVDLKEIIAPVAKETTILTPQPGSIEDFITNQGEEDIDAEEYAETKGGNRAWLFILGALLFAVIVAAVLYFFNPATRSLADQMLASALSTAPAKPDTASVAKTPPVEQSDSVNTDGSRTTQDTSIKDSLSNLTPIEKEPEPVAGVQKIEIIGATFGKRTEAETYVNIMKAKGIQAKIAEDMPGRLFKVSLGSFQDDQSAQNELNRIVKEVEKQAWIAKYKSKKTK